MTANELNRRVEEENRRRIRSYTDSELANELKNTNFSEWFSSDQLLIDETAARIEELSIRIRTLEYASINDSIYNCGF